MFTGIVEEVGRVTALNEVGTNMHFSIQCSFASELKVDQSISHNGACLTVVSRKDDQYTVVAIKETLEKTNLSDLKLASLVNLERAMKLGDRLDGHIVQGHVDQVGTCTRISNQNGSWEFEFTYDASEMNVTVEKGSITINGVSLTVVDSKQDSFTVAIIPYTFEHTNFNQIQVGDRVNLEFDVIGKYVKRLSQSYFE